MGLFPSVNTKLAAATAGLTILAEFAFLALANPIAIVGMVGIRAEGAAGLAQLRALLGGIPLALVILAFATRGPIAILAAALVPLAAL